MHVECTISARRLHGRRKQARHNLGRLLYSLCPDTQRSELATHMGRRTGVALPASCRRAS